jgi:tetratricopeptide (TPR) repeat protein
MVYVSRGQLAQADTVLRLGVEVQDRQIQQRERFPALGLHWLRGLVRLAQDDEAAVPDALAEFARERELVDLHRLYGREYAMEASQGRGFALLRAGRPHAAADAFQQALELYPQVVSAHLGLAEAWRALGLEARADHAVARADHLVSTLAEHRPIEAAMGRAQVLAVTKRWIEATRQLGQLLAEAPPGFAAWTLPIDPLLRPLRAVPAWTIVLRRLAERAG